MHITKDGQNHAPRGKHEPVCAGGEFPVGVIGLEHGHANGICRGLTEAGAEIKLVWDRDPEKVKALLAKYPGAKAARSREEIFEDDEIRLVASAAVPDERCGTGIKAMEHGKDFFSDKPPLITMEQLSTAKEAAARTGRKFGVYYSERLHVESAVYAERLLAENAIGKVIQVMGWGPHRARYPTRPEWFFDKHRYGGILVDIGCHQIEQILTFSGASSAEITHSRTANYDHPQWPQFEDFGDAAFICDNGASGYFRIDWFTPDGLGTWGDGRTLITGTEGYIEIRKYIDVAADPQGDHIILVNQDGEQHIRAAGTSGFPFFGKFIRDCLDRTENAMTQDHTFKVMELAIKAQEMAMARGTGGFK